MTDLTPEARARRIAEAFEGQTFSDPGEAKKWLAQQIEAALRDAGKVRVIRKEPPPLTFEDC